MSLGFFLQEEEDIHVFGSFFQRGRLGGLAWLSKCFFPFFFFFFFCLAFVLVQDTLRNNEIPARTPVRMSGLVLGFAIGFVIGFVIGVNRVCLTPFSLRWVDTQSS